MGNRLKNAQNARKRGRVFFPPAKQGNARCPWPREIKKIKKNISTRRYHLNKFTPQPIETITLAWGEPLGAGVCVAFPPGWVLVPRPPFFPLFNPI